MKIFVTLFMLGFISLNLSAQTVNLSGRVLNKKGVAVAGASVLLLNTDYQNACDSLGNYTLKNVKRGRYILEVTAVGYQLMNRSVEINADKSINIILQESINQLDDVNITAGKDKTSALSHLKAVEGTTINAGKKSEVIVLDNETANKATNNTRQIYSRVAGLNIWESDGAGIQLGIGGRGLNPNRVTNFNTRQNGYDISADALGYPESYYTPPAELVDRIEILRGASSLQYGTQFGGLINFKLREGAKNKAIEITSRETGGSWGFFNTTNSIAGTVGKVQYYTFFQHKQADGWRPNSEFNANTAYAGLTYKATNKLSLTFQYTYMDYLAHQPGGLTDAEFAADPRQSIRARNWFKVNWNLGAFILDYQINDNLKFNSRFFLLDASRDAVGNLDYINRTDNGADRNLFVDKYNNYGNESRLLYTYKINNISQNLLVGFRYYHGHTNRQQGLGSNGSDADFKYGNSDADLNAYTHYLFPNDNIALFAENIFRVTQKFSIIPGVRFENIITKANGSYITTNTDMAGNVVFRQESQDVKNSSRHFLIGGLGFSYIQSEALQWYANISQNYRAINFNDLNSSVKGLKVNPNLQDETGYSADFGVRGNAGDALNYDISVFTIHYNNRIGTIDTADASFNDYRYRTNIAASRNFGLESFAELEVLHFINGNMGKSKLSVFGNLALINARYTSSKETAFNNKKVEMAPDMIFKTGVTYKYNKLSASYQVSYTSSQYTDATNSTFTANAINGIVPAYTVMDFSAHYKISRFFTLEGSINNLANKHYFTRRAESYPGPGIIPADARGYYLTLEVKL
ncbi:TonB-dependent receptor [Mucilaginibacter sp. SMC90]|uniref:TonB-dependent receptor n=1 Tax=Mucilaginibacter sp. SMC90 TaxID=2929803 RepID=UPI001FB46387|nr:TonB-dependent receptor [Mucilaginibacter sp. SMC90]UOE46246.1 TonB-dependent receptor [Mucilaginibacter sp. SMC90]